MRGLIHDVRPPIEWIGRHLLGLHVEGTQVGGDSAFQWTALFCIAIGMGNHDLDIARPTAAAL